MYNDLIHNRTYNVKTAKLFGINAAVYWATLSEISLHVVKKQTFDAQGFFPLDREYVESETGLDLDQQSICEAILSQVMLLEIDKENPNRIRLNQKNWVALITEDDPATLEAVQKQAKTKKATKAEGKKAGYRRNCNNAIVATYKEEQEALEKWIDLMVESNKMFRKDQVQIFQKTLNEFTSDLNTKLAIIEIAIQNAWINASWCIDSYRKMHPTNISTLRQKKALAVDTTGF